MNLISKPLEAMPKGRHLTLSTCNRYADRTVQGYDDVREGDYLALAVSHSGEGISDNDIRHIFQRFYTKKVMGRSVMRLGLAMVWIRSRIMTVKPKFKVKRKRKAHLFSISP